MNELIKEIDKTFGVSSIGCPFGSCTNDFLLNKAIETIEKSNLENNDKYNLTKLFNENMYHSFGRFSNGKHAGKKYISIVEEYFK